MSAPAFSLPFSHNIPYIDFEAGGIARRNMTGRFFVSAVLHNYSFKISLPFRFFPHNLQVMLFGVMLFAGTGSAAKIHQWLLDDNTGTAIVDTIGSSNGTTAGNPLLAQPGVNAVVLPHSIYFDGVDDGVTITGLPALNTFTVSFWMKPAGNSGCPVARSNFNNPWTLQLASNSNAAYATLTCWINNYTTQLQHFSQSVLLNEWEHVAFVLDKPADTLRLYINGALCGKEGNLSNYSDNGSQPLTFGKRNDGAFYNGWLAGVSLWDNALSDAQIQSLYMAESGKVSGQYPRNQSYLSPDHPQLQWQPASGAIGHELYLGTDQAAVSAATTASLLFKANLTAASYQTTLTLNTTYYWRVDEVFPGSIRIKGDVLSFTFCKPNDLFKSWGLEALTRLNTGFKRTDNQYAGSLQNGVKGDVAFVWGQAVTWFALNATASYADTSYRQSTWKTFWPAFKNRYRYFYNNLWAYNAYSNQTGSADRYIDDNGHIIVALMELYDLTKDTSLVTEAETIMQFEMHYENNAPGFGGMPWHENMQGSSQNQTLNGVASTLATQAALMVYQATKKQVYLDFARRVYDYLHAHGMVRPDGIVYEGMAPDFTLNKGYLSYVTDYFIESDLIFFRIYNDSAYLQSARKRADAIYSAKMDNATGAIKETGQWGGYSHVRALHSLYKVDPDPKWRNYIFGILKYLYDHGRDNGLYGEYWDRTYTGLDTAKIDILNQASPVIGYMHAADSVLWNKEDLPSAISNIPLQQDVRREKVVDWKIQTFHGNRLVLSVPGQACGSPLSIRLFNLQGKTVFTSRTMQAPSRIIIGEGLPDGCYLLMIKNVTGDVARNVHIFR